MKIASRFPIAVHTLLCIGRFADAQRVTSEFIASSVNVNAAVIRLVLQKLKAAGFVEVERGVGGAHLIQDPATITLLDIYRAVESVEGSLFGFHDNPNPACPVGRAIEPLLTTKLDEAQNALEESLAQTTLADLLSQIDDA